MGDGRPGLLVLGAGGQVARAVLAAAAARGWRAVGAAHAELPIEDAAAIGARVAAERPRFVANCAAWTDVDGCEADPARAERINGAAPGRIAAACAGAGARLLHVSTDFVFSGRDRDRPYHPEDQPDPVSSYGRSKWHGEQNVLAAAPDAYVLRTSWVFGPGGRHFPRAIMARARRGEPLAVVDDQRGSPTLTLDLADAMLDLLASGAAGGIYHATNDGDCTWHEFAVAILAGCGLDASGIRRIRSRELARPAARPAYSVLDGRKLAALRGRPLPHWRDALARYLSLETL